MRFAIAALFWTLTVLVAYWLGVSQTVPKTDVSFSGPKRGEETKTENSPPSSGHVHGSASRIEHGPDSKTVSTGDREQGGENFPSRFSPEERLRSSHPVERLRAFAELLQTPDPDSIKTALQAYEELPGGAGRFSELKILAYAWGQVDPTAALDWAKKQEQWDEFAASAAIMDSWARREPDSAISWAKENFEGEENPYFVGIINGLSEKDLSKATELLKELPYGRVRGRSASILFEKAWNLGEDSAADWARNLPAGSLQNFAFGELGEKVAREDLSRAVAWVESMEESQIKASVSQDVAREMARKSPEEAAEWVRGIPIGESRDAAISEVARVWSRSDPVSTAEWINGFPKGENVDPAIEALVRQIVRSDPQGALSWAESIASPTRREKVLAETQRVIKARAFPGQGNVAR